MDNIETKISSKEFSANYGFGDEILVKTFEVKIKDLDGEEIPYLFIENDLKFDNQSFEYKDGYYYKELQGDETIKIIQGKM